MNMKYIFMGIIMTGIVTSGFLCKGHDRRKEGPGRWDKVWNPKDLPA